MAKRTIIPPLVLPTQTSEQNKIFVAYSGGKDSTVLLHQLAQQLTNTTVEITAIHVNHQLNPQAQQWQQHCQQFCKTLNVDFYPVEIDVGNKTRQGLEKRARDARLQAFCDFLPDQALLAMAHHQQDQAETVLLKLLRGGGVGAISAMQEITAYEHFFLWRPMLVVSKLQIQEYAIQNQLSWIEDDSNDNLQLRRNYIRKKLLPQIEETWQGASQCLASNAIQAQREKNTLNYFLQKKLNEAFIPTSPFALQSISKKNLTSLPQDVIFLLLKQWLKTHQITLLQRYLQEISRQIMNANCAEFMVTNQVQKYVLCVRHKEISLYRFIVATEETINASLLLAQEKQATQQRDCEEPISVRARIGKERITINKRQQRLKSWYKANKLPRCWRQLPLLYAGEAVIGIVGVTLFDYPVAIKTDKPTE